MEKEKEKEWKSATHSFLERQVDHVISAQTKRIVGKSLHLHWFRFAPASSALLNLLQLPLALQVSWASQSKSQLNKRQVSDFIRYVWLLHSFYVYALLLVYSYSYVSVFMCIFVSLCMYVCVSLSRWAVEIREKEKVKSINLQGLFLRKIHQSQLTTSGSEHQT